MRAGLRLELLSPEEIERIHETSLRILEGVGLKVPSKEVLDLLNGYEGISVDEYRQVVTFSEEMVMESLTGVPRSFSIYGRDKTRKVTYGDDGFVCQSTHGQVHWVEPRTKRRREGRLEDFEKCAIVGDALPNMDIMGAMIQPAEIPVEMRDIRICAELLKRIKKPVRTWIHNRTSARYILELLRVVAGGEAELRAHPMGAFGLQPISPLQLPRDGLEAAMEFARAGLPVTFGPMTQAMATGPVTLAGTVAQANAEILGALVIFQIIAPGTPTIYVGAPHIMDPRTMSLVFGSPEQGMMAVAVTQLGKRYGLPVGVNVGLTDAKVPDAQAGLEKGITLLLGALAGADTFGHMGIAGCDQGASLPQLIIDDEIIGFVKRVLEGISVDEETCAYEVVERVGIGGNFLIDEHTLRHWREELWIAGLSDRDLWEPWLTGGGKTMLDRAVERQEQILDEHTLEWLDGKMQRELDAIVTVAERELLGE